MRDGNNERKFTRSEKINLPTQSSRPRRMPNRARSTAEPFSVFFAHAGVGLSITDLEGRLLHVNPALCSLTGYEESELLGSSYTTLLIHPSDLPFEQEKTRALIAGEFPAFVIEERCIKQDGTIIWVQNNVSLISDEAGRPAKIARLTQDIAVGESEKRYRELFENSREAFYVHDLEGVYVSVNRAAEKLSGYRRHEIIGKHFSEFMTPESARYVQRQLQKILDIAGETTYEVELITKKGKHLPVEVSSRLIVEQGVPVGVQGCVRDISEIRNAQEAARNYSRRLIEAQEAERRRISRELHDQVGQILTAVKMNLHALQQTCTQPQTLASISDNLKVIDEAVDQVRDLSVDLRPLLLDDFGLVVALRWYLERQTRDIGVPAKFVSGSLGEDDRFSSELETACFRIVQEGVTNIVRHARATRISVRLERVVSDLILLINDDGAGFDARQVRAGTAGSVTLGLRGMEERALAVGGTITIDSAPALGTEICARLPIAGERKELARAAEFAKA